MARENYGVQLLDRHSICYRPGSRIILGGAHPGPETAWLIEFGSELLSFGAQPWANDKRQLQQTTLPLGRCLSVTDLRARFERARNWQREHDPGGRFIVSMTTCKLHQLLDNPCPAVPRDYRLCDAWDELKDVYWFMPSTDESLAEKRLNFAAAYGRYMSRSLSPEEREETVAQHIAQVNLLFLINPCIATEYVGDTPDIPGYP